MMINIVKVEQAVELSKSYIDWVIVLMNETLIDIILKKKK